MKKEQIIETLKLMTTYPQEAGYFFKATKHGLGLVEEAKKIAKEVWNQKFVYINMAQSDMYDVKLQLIEHSKEMEPTTFCFDEMDKADEEFRNFIFNNFSINRDILPNSHVIYIVNPDEDEDEYYKDQWNDYVMTHSMVFKVES